MKVLKPLMLVFLFTLLFMFILRVFGNLRPKTAQLIIQSDPPGQVSVDGLDKGQTPYQGIFEKEEVLVTVSAKDLQSFKKYIHLSSGVKTVLQVQLGNDISTSSWHIISLTRTGEQNSSISIFPDPDKTNIILDGNNFGEAPQKLVNLKPGLHTLILSKDGYEKTEVNLQTTQGYTLLVSSKLEASNPAIQN